MAYRIRIPKSRKELTEDALQYDMPPGISPIPQGPGTVGTSNNHPDDGSIMIEPAHTNARPIYWEDALGRILGPAKPEFLAQVGTGGKNNTNFWVVVLYEGQPGWIRSDRLRSRQSFDTQRPVQRIEPS